MHKDEGTKRIEAFSDGVFAIAITLLILQIKVPHYEMVGKNGLLRLLIDLWPSYLAFTISFFTILIMWAKHHWMFSLIQQEDHLLLCWNGLLLFCVTFLPFPTALLAEYLLHPETKIAANLYTGTIFAIEFSFYLLWRHAAKDGHLFTGRAVNAVIEEVKQVSNKYRFDPYFYFAVFVVSFFSAWASMVLSLLLTLGFAVWQVRAQG
jgi:uncharacterized membrane protein